MHPCGHFSLIKRLDPIAEKMSTGSPWLLVLLKQSPNGLPQGL
jgi:hypothetical protein